MLVYWLFWFLICFSVFISQNKNPLNKVFLGIMFILYILFVGFRYKVGGDWYTYILFYESYAHLGLIDVISNMDQGYYFLNYLGNILGFKDILFVNVICSIIIFIYLFVFSLKLKEYWLIQMICFPYYIMVVATGYTRQSVAVAISLWAFYLLINDKRYKFVLYVFFAFLFHKTAILLLIFLPIHYLKKEKVLLYSYTAFSMLFLFLALRYFTLNEESAYLGNSEVTVSSAGVLFRLSYHIIPIFCYFFYRSYYAQQKNQRIFVFLMDYTIVLISFLVVLSFSLATLVDRFNLYLIFFDIFALVGIFRIIDRKSQLILISILTIFYTLQMYMWFFYGAYAMKSWVPYSNYIVNYLKDYVL